MPLSISILGSGAVGLYYGGRLARDHDVHFLVRSDYDALRSTGLRVRSIHGDFHLPPEHLSLHTDVSTMPAADIVIVALKTTANHLLPKLLPPLLKPNTSVVTLQNGLGNEELIASIVGPERVLGGIAFTCINRTPDHSVHHSAQGLIRLGALRRDSPVAPVVAQELGRYMLVEHTPDLQHARWKKLIWNVPFNGLGAAYDLDTASLLADPIHAVTVEALMREIMAASAAVGLPFDNPDRIIRDQIAATREMGAYRTSMQIDRQQRRPLEIEAIIHQPLLRGTAAGSPMPHTATLYDHLMQTQC